MIEKRFEVREITSDVGISNGAAISYTWHHKRDRVTCSKDSLEQQ